MLQNAQHTPPVVLLRDPKLPRAGPPATRPAPTSLPHVPPLDTLCRPLPAGRRSPATRNAGPLCRRTPPSEPPLLGAGRCNPHGRADGRAPRPPGVPWGSPGVAWGAPGVPKAPPGVPWCAPGVPRGPLSVLWPPISAATRLLGSGLCLPGRPPALARCAPDSGGPDLAWPAGVFRGRVACAEADPQDTDPKPNPLAALASADGASGRLATLGAAVPGQGADHTLSG